MREVRRNPEMRNLIDKVLNNEELTENEERIAMSPDILRMICEIRTNQKLIKAMA